jgi:hypothetical protein
VTVLERKCSKKKKSIEEIMMRISNFIAVSFLVSNLKVGGSVLNAETSSSLQYAATLHKDNFGCTIQTTQASQESFCMFGHHFVSETKNIMPQDLKFAKEKHAIRSNIALESDLFFSDFLIENNSASLAKWLKIVQKFLMLSS